jgi:phospholipase/carboxylesterase
MRLDYDFRNVRGKAVFEAALDSITSEMEELGDVKYIEASGLYKVRVCLPENYNSNKRYPLLIGLHGHTGSAEGFMRHWDTFDQPEFIFAVPEAPYHVPGSRNSYSWRVSGTAGAYTTTSTTTTEKYIAEVARVLNKRYNATEVYLFGYSQGCTFTYNVGIKFPYLFTGLICFGGWLETRWLTEQAIGAANRLRVFIAHGTNDETRPFREGLAAKELLESHGYDVTFVSFEGGHIIPENILKQAQAWMSK